MKKIIFLLATVLIIVLSFDQAFGQYNKIDSTIVNPIPVRATTELQELAYEVRKLKAEILNLNKSRAKMDGKIELTQKSVSALNVKLVEEISITKKEGAEMAQNTKNELKGELDEKAKGLESLVESEVAFESMVRDSIDTENSNQLTSFKSFTYKWGLGGISIAILLGFGSLVYSWRSKSNFQSSLEDLKNSKVS